MGTPSVVAVRDAAARVAFGNRLVQNNLRALVVETIVEFALSPSWVRCAGDWSGWDFRHVNGARLEVKQSASLQTWAAPDRPGVPRFDIAPRAGFFDGAAWTARPGRQAHLHVFAIHSVLDETADHRDASQWRFHVVSTAKLPAGKSIGATVLRALMPEVRWGELFEAVERVRKEMTLSAGDPI